MKIKFSYISIIFILVISFSVLFWFKGNHIIFSGDYLPILRPISEFYQDFFSWTSIDASGLGGYTGSLPKIFPYESLTAFGSLLGFSIIGLQKILFYLFLSVSGLSMFLLVYSLFEESKNKNLAALFAALFYMFNTYTLFFKWPDRLPSLFSYSLLPLSLAFYVKGLEKKNNFLYSVGIAITFLFMAPAVTTPTYFIIVGLILFLYLVFYNFFCFSRKKLKASILFSIKSLILFILFNSWWILVYYFNIFDTNLGSSAFQTVKSFESFNSTAVINSFSTSFLNIFRVMGYWALDIKDKGISYYPLLSKVYASFLFICISIFIPILVFSSSLVKKIDKKTKGILLFFSFLSVVSLFFIKGMHSPFGAINQWIFFNIPGFSIFRSQYEKLGTILVLGYSVLFGYSVSYFYSYFKAKGKIILGKFFIIIIFLIFFIINTFPFWTGQNIQVQRGHLISQRVTVPAYYNEAYNWLNELRLDKRLLIFPLLKNNFFNANHKWGGANGNILSKLFSQSVILKLFFDQTSGLNNNENLLIKILPQVNVQYIFTDDSRVPDVTNKEDSKQINISPRDSINFVKEFDQLKFYKINSNNFLPHFYTPKTLITTSQNLDILPEIVSQPDYKVRSAIYFNQQNSNIPNQFLNKSSIFTSLFDSAEKNKKENNLILNKYQSNSTFVLNKTYDANTFVNVKYFSDTKKILVSDQSAERIFINDEEIVIKPSPLLEVSGRVGDFLKIGENYFSVQSGYNKVFKLSEIAAGFDIYQAKPVNQIKLSNSSFEEGLWQKTPSDCSNGNPGEPDLNMQLSRDVSDGKYSLELESKNHFACTTKSFPINLKKDKVYKYSFDYKNVKGDKVEYYYNLIGKNKSYSFSESISTDNQEWNHYETIIKPEEDISKIELYFYAPSDGYEELVDRYDNIGLSEVEMNKVVTDEINQNKPASNQVIKNNIKLKEGDNAIEYKGNTEADGTLPKDLYNYYLQSNSPEIINTPIIEFKKINPTKYRVIIHHATDNFPLVFSESFHDGWKTYLVADKKIALNFNSADYKIIDGNLDDQASPEELTNFINSGYISTLGNLKEQNIKHVKWENNREVFDYNENYKIDFISKNFQDTIQNDNLAPGSFYETWFKKPVADNQNHLMVNGYANSWNISPTGLCGAPDGKALCVRNADGSYDLELVVEFWPQRLFYIGLFISGATLFGCLGYLGWELVRRRKKKGDVEGEIKED